MRNSGTPRPHKTDISPRAASLFEHTDLADAYATPWRPGMPTDAPTWVDATFHHVPGWVFWLLRLRNRLVPLIGVPPSSKDAFATLTTYSDEVILGADEPHLDFRASVRVAEAQVVVSTVARATNRRGRFYLFIIRLIHPVIVRAMLARAARSLSAG